VGRGPRVLQGRAVHRRHDRQAPPPPPFRRSAVPPFRRGPPQGEAGSGWCL